MNDYFDRVEQGLREAVRDRAHVPWYMRPRLRPSRPAIVAVASLLAAGSALAATGVFRTGAPVGAEVPPLANADNGIAIPGSVHLLALRVADPEGGPPWGLRVVKTTRGLMCVQVGRVVDGRLGVIGEDGAFADDGLFHPLSADFLNEGGCGTEDADGDAFVNEQINGFPASALAGGERYGSGGCYGQQTVPNSCPPSALRDVYYGLLGPDAVSVTHETASGGRATTATTGSDGAYLVVLPHSVAHCSLYAPSCSGGESSTGGPTLESSEVIRVVHYRGAPSCRVPTAAEVAERESVPRQGHGCAPVGYVARPVARFTEAQLATPISARVESAARYCERREVVEPCDGGLPKGFKRIDLPGGPLVLVVVEFTTRVAVANFDSHYEIHMSDPSDPANPRCPSAGASSFGPTETDLRAGQRVRHTQLVNPECRGRSHITVSFESVNGPATGTPVPGLPGQGPEIPIGRTSVAIP
jgi:hypothetical protein